MEAALVSAATGALKPVLEKLAALLGEKYKRFKAVRKDIKYLTHELAAMDAFLMKMSEVEDPDVQDKIWMNEVRELSYDMEDCVDDFMQSVDDKSSKPDGFIEKIKHSMWKMKARRRIGNEIHDLKTQITEVGERNARYKTRQGCANMKSETVDPRDLVIFEHASNLIGIDEPKAEIIKLLIEEDQYAPTQQQPNIVSVVGSGGMGKTTLANQVYQELKGEFKCRAFLSVSQNPEMRNILRIILSQVSNRSYGQTEEGSVQQLIMNINDFLIDKRYIIVVDDIWDVQTWDIIKLAFPINNLGSIIITTTRMNDVAHSCCSSFDGHVYKIKPLDMVHSRQLFHRRLFNSEENCPSYLKEVSEQILEKCVGLPLAIIAVSGLLANKEETEHLWNQVKDSIGLALERNASVELMMKILSLSYHDLPAHLKTCLLYLSMYQEDRIIEKKELIRTWIAEGFIHKEGRYTTHELGERYLNDLLNRSLIQLEKTNRYGKLKSCRIHDTVRDFIISKSIEENFVTLVGVPNLAVGTQGKVRRLSLHVDQQGDYILPSGLVLSHVRSLSVPGCYVVFPYLDEFRHLRVLHLLKVCFHLNNTHLANIGRLLQLRYLILQDMYELSELPEEIGDLGCLETLDIRGTRIHDLPATIVKLKILVDLLANSGVRFPDGIGKLQSLEVLKRVRVFPQPFNFLVEIGHLKNLKKLVLDFENRSAKSRNSEGYIHERKKLIFTSLHNLGTHNLRSLEIVHGGIFLEEPSFPTPLNLQKLKTRYSAVPRVPDWMAFLVNLQQLCLEVDVVGQEGLCILGGLRALHILDLKQQRGVKNSSDERFIVSVGAGFRCLRQFFYHTFAGMDLVFAAGSMPKLQKLDLNCNSDLTQCKKKRDLTPCLITAPLDFGIKNLRCLHALTFTARGCHINAEAVKSAMETALSTHPNFPTLLFKKV